MKNRALQVSLMKAAFHNAGAEVKHYLYWENFRKHWQDVLNHDENISKEALQEEAKQERLMKHSM